VKIDGMMNTMDETWTTRIPPLTSRTPMTLTLGTRHGGDEVREEEVRDPQVQGELHIVDQTRGRKSRMAERGEGGREESGGVGDDGGQRVVVGNQLQDGVIVKDSEKDGMSRLPLLLQRGAARTVAVAAIRRHARDDKRGGRREV
jgi:hypothetical protein